jgi:hypothetical protein
LWAVSEARSTPHRLDVERDLADRLRRVGVEQDAFSFAILPISAIGAMVPDLVVGGHHRDQDRLVVIAARTVLGIHRPVLVHRQDGDLEAVLLEVLAGVDDRLVLGRAR